MAITSTTRSFEEFIPQPTVIDRTFEQMSPLEDPNFQKLFEQIMGSIPETKEAPALKKTGDFINQALMSPLLQMILQPALANLEKGVQKGRGNLVDMFRAAGGGKGPTRGTPFAQASGQFESDVVGQRGSLISQITSQTLSPLLQSLMQEQAQEQDRFFKSQEAAFDPVTVMMGILQRIRPDLVQTGQTQTGGQFFETGSQQVSGGGGGSGAAPGRASGQTSLGSAAERNARMPSLARSGSGFIPNTRTQAQPNTTTGDSLLDQILLNFGGDAGGGGIQYDPGTGTFVSSPMQGAGDFGVGSEPFGLFENFFDEDFS